MRASQLLRLYPRAWRDRYGEEFLAAAGPGRLSLQQMVDVVSGAIDAWLSTDVRNATRAISAATTGGGTMTVRTMICRRSDARYTTRDALIGAAVMIAASIAFLVLAISMRKAGWDAAGKTVAGLAFQVSMALSMPFWLVKHQPWKAQVVIVGGTVGFLVLIGYLSTVI